MDEKIPAPKKLTKDQLKKLKGGKAGLGDLPPLEPPRGDTKGPIDKKSQGR